MFMMMARKIKRSGKEKEAMEKEAVIRDPVKEERDKVIKGIAKRIADAWKKTCEAYERERGG